jgi:titin
LDVAAGGGGTKIIGLTIDQFVSYGIRLTSSGNFVQGNYIGIDSTGTLTGRGNVTGIYITGSNNQIDGTTAAGRNVISGNTNDGIQIDGSSGASGNVVKGNYIGVNAAGNAALKNGGQGVIIYLGATSNTIGGNTPVWPGAGNLISGNGNIGIAINNPGTTLNVVRGNRIGTDATGAAAIGNLGRGVSLDQSAAGNTIGGTTLGDGNTIANSGSNGVWMGGNATVDNAILGNNIFSSGAVASPIPGIDLNGNGVDINDTGDLDTVANEGSNRTQNHPVLTAAMANL